MKRLLFIGPVEKYFVREMLRGLAGEDPFMQQWLVRMNAAPGSAAGWAHLLRKVQPDALVIHAFLGAAERQLVERTGRPLILLETGQPVTGLRLTVDNEAVGRLAADYFLAHQFHEFAYLGYQGMPVFAQRGAAFQRRLAQAGFAARLLQLSPPAPTRPPFAGARPAPWVAALLRLPRAPCAVFCGNDEIAARVLEQCQRANLRVPHDLAILGVNNDSLLCRLCYPPLSSMSLPYRELGRLAADRLLHWQPQCARTDHVLRLPPGEVVERQSTNLQSIDDPIMRRAVDFMLAHLGEPFPMQQLRHHTGVSTPTLMKHFRTHLRMTPVAQLRCLRIQHARRLLLDPALDLPHVAHRCGFRRTEHFLTTFKQLTGLTATAYRQEHRAVPPPPAAAAAATGGAV